MTMKSINFVVLGDASIASELGKKGSVTDITFHERKASHNIMTFAVPSGFPEKIQPLVQAIALSEYALLNITKIDKELGEQIVALDAAKLSRGFIIANGMDDDIRKIIKSTVLETYEFVTLDEFKQKMETLEQVAQSGPTKVVVDAAFEVKGVGTIALGIVRRGTAKKHDELEIFPEKRSLQVRSIQMHDDDVDFAESPGRVGLALKGINASEINRGDMLAAKDSLKIGKELKIKFERSKFYREEVKPTSSYHLCLGLQIKPVKFDGTVAVSDRPFAFETGEGCVVLDLNSTSVRIVGSGTVL